MKKIGHFISGKEEFENSNTINLYNPNNAELIGKVSLASPKIIDKVILSSMSALNEWKSYSNHNQLRITRIIECLRLLISDEEADSFYSLILSMVGEETEINEITLDYWSKA